MKQVLQQTQKKQSFKTQKK